MEFNKDTLKKVIKYVLMMVVVTFAALSVPKQLISMNDASLIGIVAASVFVVLDLVMPSICLRNH
tara:strand:- start:173 stop:367 length:195 start_codon:yes stop_codon:yes gene_type:complete